MSTSVVIRKGPSRLFPTDTAVPRIVTNRRHESLQYFQLMTGLSNPSPSEMLAPSSPLTCLLETPSSCITKWIFVVFLWLCDLRTPFNVKMNFMRFSYHSYAHTMIILMINTISNYLNRVEISHKYALLDQLLGILFNKFLFNSVTQILSDSISPGNNSKYLFKSIKCAV